MKILEIKKNEQREIKQKEESQTVGKSQERVSHVSKCSLW